MIRLARAVSVFVILMLCAASASSPAHGGGEDATARDIPTDFAPLEYLIGKWKGQGVPKDKSAQQFRGWDEKHAWAWIFDHGKPTGLSLTIEGGKFLASGKVTFNPKTKLYRLEGKEPGPRGAAIAFEGKLDSSGKRLVLDCVRKKSGAELEADAMQISIRPNANFLRYTMTQDLKPEGAAQFSRAIEVGVTKEGETFAAGAAVSERPKCIVTGGQATMSVTFEGQTFQLCCSGCLGEFNDNPQKYVKKAALIAASQAAKPKSAGGPPRARGRDDAFAGDVLESTDSPAPAAKAKMKDTPAATKVAAAKKEESEASQPDQAKPAAPKKDAAKTPASKAAARAATLVRLGRALERAGKTEQALANYRQVVKDYADSPSAKSARERIKVLEKE
jgi:YHS domain-containing protein